jgi:hypothetical protein
VTDRAETEAVLRTYADAWLAADLEKVLGSYHEEIVLHYMGESPLAGTHEGSEDVFEILGLASFRTSRKLVEVEDVLAGDEFGAIVAIEDLGDPPKRVRRLLLYRVVDGKLGECWLFDEDQRFIDRLWSSDPAPSGE